MTTNAEQGLSRLEAEQATLLAERTLLEGEMTRLAEEEHAAQLAADVGEAPDESEVQRIAAKRKLAVTRWEQVTAVLGGLAARMAAVADLAARRRFDADLEAYNRLAERDGELAGAYVEAAVSLVAVQVQVQAHNAEKERLHSRLFEYARARRMNVPPRSAPVATPLGNPALLAAQYGMDAVAEARRQLGADAPTVADDDVPY